MDLGEQQLAWDQETNILTLSGHGSRTQVRRGAVDKAALEVAQIVCAAVSQGKRLNIGQVKDLITLTTNNTEQTNAIKRAVSLKWITQETVGTTKLHGVGPDFPSEGKMSWLEGIREAG